MKTLISIDPGQSTGVVIGKYSEHLPFTLMHAFQFEGGVEGFLRSVNVQEDFIGVTRDLVFGETPEVPGVAATLDYLDEDRDELVACSTVVAEKFTARGSGNGFSYRTDALEPLRVEGALLAMGLNPEWRQPPKQYFMAPAGTPLNEKKKLAHKWLKDKGLYIAPKDVGCKDANDARSAALHAIAWLRDKHHIPTLKHYFGG